MSKNEVKEIKECEYYKGKELCCGQPIVVARCKDRPDCLVRKLQQLKEENKKLEEDLEKSYKNYGSLKICFDNVSDIASQETKKKWEFQDKFTIALDALEFYAKEESYQEGKDKYNMPTTELILLDNGLIAKQAIEKINGGGSENR